MRPQAIGTIMVLAIWAYGCHKSNPSSSLIGPSETDVTFSGRVVEFRTQAPVGGVNVRFTLEPPDPRFGPSDTTTSADGRYVLTVPRTGFFRVTVEDGFAGATWVNGAAYRGTLLTRGGTCVSRYGVVIDGRTLRPIQDATVTLTGRTATTGADGWYRIDLGCPDQIVFGGTTFIYVKHPEYEPGERVVGRGVSAVQRLDVDLKHR